MYRKQYKKPVKVMCKKCNMWIDEDKVEFRNIEEDIYGHDVLTFICPECKTKQKSKRFY